MRTASTKQLRPRTPLIPERTQIAQVHRSHPLQNLTRISRDGNATNQLESNARPVAKRWRQEWGTPYVRVMRSVKPKGQATRHPQTLANSEIIWRDNGAN